jgi:BASS family bile acid:Na+ symporter
MEQSPLVDAGLPIALFVIMIGIGLSLTPADFQREAKRPAGAVIASVAQLLIMPILGFAFAALLSLPPALAVGLVIAASCPGGATSNLISYLARANVALSIVLTVISSVAVIVTLPFYVNIALRWQPADPDVVVRLPLGRTVLLLVGIILIPVLIGMATRRRSPDKARSLEKAVSAFGGVVLALLIIGIAYSVRDRFWDLLADAGPAAVLLNLSGIAVGYLVTAGAKLPRVDRLTAAVELGVKNTTIGILVALTVIGSETMAVPSAVYGLLMYASAFALVAYGRRSFGTAGDAATP